jgi:hypothetical protein
MQHYIQLWQEVEPQVAQGVPVEDVCAQINDSGMDPDLCERMIEQVKLLDEHGGARDVSA